MLKLHKITITQVGCFVALIMTLSGCSSSFNNSNSSVLPTIPEIRSKTPSANAKPKRVVKKAPAKPSKVVAKVKKYSITSKISTVITQQEVNAVRKKLVPTTVEIDPYDSIPDNSESINKPSSKLATNKSSPAVVSLTARARADIATGRTQSAVSKLERGLRIESQNPNIWNLLAKARYNQRDYQQAITMAKKSIRYATGDKLIAQNWQLIKDAGKKSDDTIALKEALDYFKVNP